MTQGADVNYADRLMHEGREMSTTPLIEAAGNGHADAARVLISRGAELNKHEPCDGETALHRSAEECHVPVIEPLMSKGARIDVRDKFGLTPLHMAVIMGHKEASICLLDHGADINTKCNLGSTPLSSSAQKGHLPLVKLLILCGADLNLADCQGATSLMKAAGMGHLEVVKILVEKGAVVDQPYNDGVGTALCQGSLNGHLEVVGFLLSAGANINHLDANGMSPLFAAAQGGHLSVVKLLVKRGADIHQASNQGVTPLHRAALSGYNEVVDYLMSKGAEFETRGTPAKVCKCCGATDIPVHRCTRCLVVHYCNPECQKKDWKEGGENRHKIQCARLVEMRARYMEKAKKEVEEQMVRFGVSSKVSGKGRGVGPSNS